MSKYTLYSYFTLSRKDFFFRPAPLSILLLFLRLILSPTGFFAKFAADMSSKKKVYDNNGPGIFSDFIGVLFEKDYLSHIWENPHHPHPWGMSELKHA